MSGSAIHILGVDGGGSGCRATLADGAGTVLATGEAGPANATSDFVGAVANIRAAIDAACKGYNLSDLRAHIGLAGILSETDAKRFALALGLPQACVTDDRPTTLAGALGGQDGLIAAIGTGSFVGANHSGETRFLGGWGLQLGDQASGAWLGKTLLQQAMLVHDGLTPQSPLTDAVLAEFNGPNALVSFARTATPTDYATYAPRVADAAEAGDTVAARAMDVGAGYLSKALKSLDPSPTTPLCLTGGLGPRYARWLPPELSARVAAAKGTALDGAVYLATQQ
ncbi:MAG: BadF/BadG/BcrA/BcrD ATPase family protein [Pseudomonadota bacterium]